MEHTKETLDEALVLLNQSLAEFRTGNFTKFDWGAVSDNIEILFSKVDDDEFTVDIYLLSDEFHENQIAGFICEDFEHFTEIEPMPYLRKIQLAPSV